jgi:branched-chain amino acid transport system substrate-binding protein
MLKHSFGVSILGFILVLFVIAAPAFGEEPIKIGIIMPLSGGYAQNGTDLLNGALFYLEKIGYKMGGRKVELIPEDEEGNPATALNKARKLVEMNKIHMLVGPHLTSSAYAVQAYLESKRMPTLIFASADDLTQRKRGHWGVRAGYASSQPVHPFGEYAYKVLGFRKIVTVAADYAFGYEVVGGFQRTFEESGGKIIQKIWFPVNVNDFSPYLSQIRRDADAMFSQFGGKAAVMLDKQFYEYGLKGKMASIGLMHISDETILPTIGPEIALGIITTGNYSAALDTPMNKEFARAFRERFKRPPTHTSVMSHDILQLIDQAVASLRGEVGDPEKLVKAFKSVDLKETPRGPLKLDAYGNAIQNIYIRKVEMVGGALQNTVIHTYPEVSQFWKYKPEEFLKQPVYSRDYPPLKP